LRHRLDERLARMFDGGLLDEVRKILAMGVPRTAKPFESLGYKEALAVIEGRMTPQEALAAGQLATRQYAKRQMTWFRREQEVLWIEGFGDDSEVRGTAVALLQDFLK
jgi:tRNA dimethylallyltransferase